MIYAVNKQTKEHRVASEGWAFTGDWQYIKADADGWIDWLGNDEESPLPNGSLCDYITRDAKQHLAGDADIMRWLHSGVCYSRPYDIIAYRPILEPQAEQVRGWRGPEDGLPPVGTVCERELAGGRWVKCEILAADGGAVWVRTEKGHATFVDPSVFRPIRTDRDRWIEAAMNRGGLRTRDGAKEVYGKLFDAGLARLPD